MTFLSKSPSFLSKSPSFLSFAAIIITVSAFAAICIFTGIVEVPSEPRISRNDSHKKIEHQRANSSEHRRASPSFLASSEKARQRFLKKVANEILQGRAPSKIPPSGMVTKGWFAVWNAFTPIYSCPHVLDRIGTLIDGGKWVCGVDVYEKTKEDPCVIYSFGVGEDSTFEIEMVTRTNCTVYAFDHTRNEIAFPKDLDPKLKERIQFFKVGIGSKAQVLNNSKLATLKDVMDQNGHTWVDFLKMDIESNEFPVLKDIAEDFQTFPFGHLNLEVHLENWKATAFGRMYDLWTILERRGLRAVFWEPNFNAFFRNNPFLMEFSFINVADLKSRLLRF